MHLICLKIKDEPALFFGGITKEDAAQAARSAISDKLGCSLNEIDGFFLTENGIRILESGQLLETPLLKNRLSALVENCGSNPEKFLDAFFVR